MNQKWTEKTHIYWSTRKIWNTQFPKKNILILGQHGSSTSIRHLLSNSCNSPSMKVTIDILQSANPMKKHLPFIWGKQKKCIRKCLDLCSFGLTTRNEMLDNYINWQSHLNGATFSFIEYTMWVRDFSKFFPLAWTFYFSLTYCSLNLDKRIDRYKRSIFWVESRN